MLPVDALGTSTGHCTIAETHCRKHQKTQKNEKIQKEKKNELREPNLVKLCTFSPYKDRSEGKKKTLLNFHGSVQVGSRESTCSILVDSGCEVVISKEFANKLQIKGKHTDLNAELWDGTLVTMNTCSKSFTIRIGEATIRGKPYIVEWIAYDIILGMSWLSKANPIICLLYTSPSPRDGATSRMPSSA